MTYLNEVKSIVSSIALWGAIKYEGELKEVLIGGLPAYTLGDCIIAIKDKSWNDILGMSMFHTDGSEREEPLFKVINTTTKMRIGILSEVYRKGWVCFPLDGEIDYMNKPIVLIKGIK